MSRRRQIIVLSVLVALLAAVLYMNRRGPAPAPMAAATGPYTFKPLDVETLVLKTYLLDQLKRSKYEGPRRNIFSATAPPPAVSSAQNNQKQQRPMGPEPAPPPPPIVLPAKFFGYVFDVRTGTRRAFFTNGEDVYIVAEGETLLNRFRLLRINNNTADVEEIASGRKTTVNLEEAPAA